MSTIYQGYGQFSQDVFADQILEEKRGGFFLDIGAGVSDHSAYQVPLHTMSNTCALERHRGWNGIAIDYDKDYCEVAKKFRSCSVSCTDLLEENINSVLERLQAPNKIDYLSLDVDSAQERVLRELDFDTYKFSVITYEHNLSVEPSHYSEMDWVAHQAESRDKFLKLGYNLVFGNVGFTDEEKIEDWWVDDETFAKWGLGSHDNCRVLTSLEMLHSRYGDMKL
jgi:hypothetical protein